MKTEAEFSEHLQKMRQAVPKAPGFVDGVMTALPAAPPDGRRWGWSIAAAAVLAVGLAGGVAALMLSKSSVAFADVAARVRAVHTLKAQGKDYRNGEWFKYLIVARDQAERCDFATPQDCGSPRGFIDGWIDNDASGEQLDLSKARRRAFHWDVKPRNFNYVQWLKEFASHDGQPLGERVIDGRKLVGFHGKASAPADPPIAHDIEEGDVWVDAASKLPVRIEFYKDGDKKPWRIVENIQFDVALDDQLFSTTPPEGYQVVKMPGLRANQLRPPASEQEAGKFVIEPGQGVGAARVDMNRAQIEEALGPAEEVQLYEEYGEVELYYYSRGFRVLVQEPEKGRAPWARFECFQENYLDQFCHSFPGRTTEGVGLGANRRQVEAAYGPAAKEARPRSLFEGSTRLDYPSRGIIFDLYEDKVVFITITAPAKQ